VEDRFQDIARKESVDLQRLRRQVAFDRLLARLFQAAQPLALPWILKSGYAMELRIKAARTTKDIDFTIRNVFSSDEKKDHKKNLAVLEKLRQAAAFSCDDFFVTRWVSQFLTYMLPRMVARGFRSRLASMVA
jgi:hypothetical protein